MGVKETTLKQNGEDISQSIFIGFITVLGYVLAYYFELGFKGYYHIPEIFVEASFSKVILAIVKIWAITLPFLMVINIAPDFFPKTPLKRRWFLLVAVFFFFFLLLEKDRVILYFLLGLLGFFLILDFVLPLIFYRNTPGYWNKIEEAEKNDGSMTTLLDLAKIKFGKKILVVFLFISLIPTAQYFGRHYAKNRTEYLIIKEPKPMAILDTFQGKAIIAPIDEKGKTISPKFKLIELTSITNEMEWVKIGRLKVEK